MESPAFCQTPFWDSSLTWYTDNPDFTRCFQHSILIWVPCGIFLLWALTEWTFFKRLKKPQLPRTTLFLTKFFLASMLASISGAELLGGLYSLTQGTMPYVIPISGLVRTLTFMLVIYQLVVDKRQGQRSSGKLFVFWLLTSMASIVQYRSLLLAAWGENFRILEDKEFFLGMIFHPLVFASFFLCCFNEPSPLLLAGTVTEQDLCPWEEASFLSKLTVSWVDEVVIKGYRTLLAVKDFGRLSDTFASYYMWQRFLLKWKSGPTSSKSQASLTKTLAKAFWPLCLLGALYELAYTFLRFVPPLLLNLLIENVGSDQEPQWHGYLYSALMLVSSVVAGLASQHVLFCMIGVGMQVRSALIAAVYRKALRLSNGARQNFTVGEQVNFMAVDAEKVYNLSIFLNMLWGAPLRIIISVILLWQYLGPSCLAGVAIMVVMMPITLVVAHFCDKIQGKQMEVKDKRIKFMNEILNGIKVLKLYAWEIPFMNQITDLRESEIQLLKKYSYLNACFAFIWSITPYFIAVSSFATYVLTDPSHVLDASKAFVSLTLFNTMRFSLVILPELISNCVQTRVSLERIRKFLVSEEIKAEDVTHHPAEGEAITITKANFRWSEERMEPVILKDITLHVPKGALVAVIGTVGSGKSSLLSAMLGEMSRQSGSLDIQGSTAYVAQQAWIQNATLRQNVLFLKPYDRYLYNKVIEACSLTPDLQIFEGGDMIEIGEKGVNLSGGQKQRVSLARAVYQNRDIYLLDDPLSAVDAHVGRHIFQHVIGPKGILKHKTRVLVTHALSVLPETDLVVVMEGGQVREMGTYQDLLARPDGALALLMEEHANTQDSANDFDVSFLKRPLGVSRLKSQLSVGQSGDEPEMRRRSKSNLSTGRRSSSHDPTAATQLIEEEKMEMGKVQWKVYLSYLRNARYFLTSVAFLMLTLYQTCEVSANLWLSQWSGDAPLPDGTQDIPLRNLRVSVYAAIGLGEGLALLIGVFLIAKAAMNASRSLHFYMLDSIMRSPMAFFDTTPLGRILNRFGKDMDTVDTQIHLTFDNYIQCFLSVVGTFIVIALSNSIFIAILLPISVFYYLVQMVYIASCRQIKRMESIYRSPIYNNFSETVSGLSTIRAFRAQDYFQQRNDERVDINQICIFNIVGINRWLGLRLEFLGDLITFCVAIVAISTRGSMAPGLVGLALTYSMSVTESFNWLVRMSTELETKIVAVERIEEYSVLPSEAPWHIMSRDPPAEWPTEGRVELRDYSTRYREGLDLVLKGVNLGVEPGQKVGIVGRTGAGKSSLTLALFRIVEPAEGRILLDGLDVSELGLHRLRSRLAIIPQDPVLFTGSLRDNLDPSHDHGDPQLWQALRQAHLGKFVSGLTGGLDHAVSEGGLNLSVGQRQLVCLARALLKKSKVLILDEATAAVDLDTDRLIQNTIREEFQNCTILTIAHRLHTIMDYDRVLVMDRGKVVEEGNPSQLLDRPASHFYSMAKDAGLV